MITPIFVVFLALFLSYIFSEVARYFRIPRVVGQVLVGFLLGIPMIKPYLFQSEVSVIFSFISDLAMILLFYFVGMEISLRSFRKYLKETSLIAIFNTTLPLVSGFLLCRYFFGLDTLVSLIVGVSLSVSSLAISLDVLEELKMIKSNIGKLIITTSAVDDVFEFLLISFILISFHVLMPQASLLNMGVDIVLFAFVVISFAFLIIPKLLKLFDIEKNSTHLFTGALVIVLIMAYLSDLLGIGSLIGAFVAGILVRYILFTEKKPWEEHSIARSVHLISFGFLVPIFFVWVGVNTNILDAPENILLILLLLTVGVLGTLLGTIIGVVMSGGTKMDGLKVGFGVLPKGDVELAIAALALETGLINNAIYSAIVIVAFLTTFFSPIIFEFLLKQKA